MALKDDWCPFWGPQSHQHLDCGVILREASSSALKAADLPALPALCMCDCRTCKRAWWAAGRPTEEKLHGQE